MLSRTIRAAPIRTLRPLGVQPVRRTYATGGDDPAEFRANTSRVDRSNTSMFLVGGLSLAVGVIYFLGIANRRTATEITHKMDPGAVEHMKPNAGEKDPNYAPRTDKFGK
ncbi:hypothetical protein HJFPF1_00318 [Paramyrothecium foliicola]|nr:hypothetical protein HJFPF1_00318 [Paramyrothecium foliicola]